MQASPPKTVHYVDIIKRPRFLNVIEAQRNKRNLGLLRELWAELIGCIIYSYIGIGSALNVTYAIVTKQPSLSTGPMQIGIAVAFGIIIAVSIGGSTSAAHFNPGITIAHTIYRGFPLRKVPFYLFTHILGGYMACLFIYYQNLYMFHQIEDIMRKEGVLEQLMFSNAGPSGVFAFYLPQGQSMWGAWLNEFIASFFACTAYWAVMDPTNTLVTPRMSVWVVAFAYGVSIWSFGAILNTSRDLGGRLFAMTIWGRRASAGSFAAISALTNIAAMIVAVFFYEVVLCDTRRVVNAESLEHVRLVTNTLESADSKREDDMGINTPSSTTSRDGSERLDMFTLVEETRKHSSKAGEV